MGSRSLKNRPGAKKKHPFTGVLFVLSVLGVIVVGGAIAVGVLCSQWLQDLPDYESADAFNTAQPTVVYAADGTTELARFQLENRDPVTADEISSYVLAGTVATEDERFYSHGAIDIAGMARAVVNNLAGGSLEGASTITQQFVRNTILADEMDDISIKRKVREAYLATKVEERYSKDEILVMYLNTINYGDGCYGVEAASEHYFSKPASDLTLAEAALLVGIPQSPTYNNPSSYPDNAVSRRNTVLNRMLTNGYITQSQYDEAVAEPLELNISNRSDDGIEAYPYFTSYVRNLLYNSYDLSEADVMKGGLTVHTTLDVKTQQEAEEAVEKKKESLPDYLEVAMAVVDPNNGNVLAIVGGSDYESSQVNLATGDGGGGRPCGSAFKVFTLVTAIEKGIDPNTTYVDCSSPATVDGYTLSNYNNTNYGTRSIARALAVSSNTGFVRLISSIGVKDVADVAHAMGITSNLNENTTGASMTLGVQNVTPLEMADAYATIANGGTHYDVTAVSYIESSDGRVILDNRNATARSQRVLSPEVAHAAEKVMEGVVNTSEGTGTAAALSSGQVVAGKTGTSEDYKDITFTGITPQLSASIWCGDPSNQQSVPTGTTVADVFNTFATAALAGQSPVDFPTASDPEYKAYSDSKHQIYSYGSSSSNSQSGSFSSTDNQSGASGGSSSSATGTGTGTGAQGTANLPGTSTGTGGSTGGSTGSEADSGAGSGGSGGSSGGDSGGGSGGSGTGSGGAGSGSGTGSGDAGNTGGSTGGSGASTGGNTPESAPTAG